MIKIIDLKITEGNPCIATFNDGTSITYITDEKTTPVTIGMSLNEFFSTDAIIKETSISQHLKG